MWALEIAVKEIDMTGGRKEGVKFGMIALAIMAVDFILCWCLLGGWWNFDTIVQWRQVQSGVYTQWHPFAHTFLMMKLPSLIWNDYRVAVFWQIAWFAVAFGYLAWALASVGVRRKWLWIWLGLTLLHPQTLFFLMTPLKDSAFAIAVMVVLSALALVCVKGVESLADRCVRWPLAVSLALAMTFRHNGLFFVLPTLAMLVVLHVRKNPRLVVHAILSFALVLGALKWVMPLPFTVRPASACPEKHFFIESCGVPLSMMGAVYMKHPDEIPENARELLESIAPREVWFGKNNWSFNAVKYHGTAQLDDERIAGYKFTGWKDFFDEFVGTVKVDAPVALRTLFAVTGQVWNPAGHPPLQFVFPLEKVGFDRQTARKVLPFISTFSIPLVGIVGLVIWFCLIVSVYVVLKRRWPILLLTLPILCYNLGTMMFLSGFAAYRFFFCNVLVIGLFTLMTCIRKRGE